MPDTLADYDYVIVGAGASGCLLANRLSADASVRVLLVEAGDGGEYFWSRIPMGYHRCVGNPKVDWCHVTEPVPGLNGRQIAFARGRGLGGSTAIGGMIYLRGHAEDFEDWARAGNEGWGWDDVLPSFLRHEDQLALAAAEFRGLHAAGGEWRVEAPRLTLPVLDAWADACAQAGIPRLADLNVPAPLGSAYFGVNQKAGNRWDSSKAFIGPALHRKNLSIITQAHVERVSISKGRARGVLLRRNGFPLPIGVSREIILAAGAIGSPRILMSSGLGPGTVLQLAGVAVVRDMAGVGENYQDHLEIPLVYAVKGAEASLNERSRSLFEQGRMVAGFALKRSGPLAMAPAPMGTVSISDEGQSRANLLFKVEPYSLTESGDTFEAGPAITVSVSDLRPMSRGHVRITSPDPLAAPAIQPNYLEAEVDREIAVQALRVVRHIMAHPAMAGFAPEETRPGSGYQTDEDLLAAAGDLGRSAGDAVGTCRMGRDETAVVDPRLKVHGIEGLRVADASIMPTIVSGGAAAATLMIAEKAAAMIGEDWKG